MRAHVSTTDTAVVDCDICHHTVRKVMDDSFAALSENERNTASHTVQKKKASDFVMIITSFTMLIKILTSG